MFGKKTISIGENASVRDVFIGKKKLELNLTVNNITSPEDLFNALKKNACDGDNFKELLEPLLQDSEFRKKFSEFSQSAFYREASIYLRDIISKFQASGPEGLPLGKLKELMAEARAKKDRAAVNYIGLHLLQLVVNEPAIDEYYVAIAQELVANPTEDGNYPVARIVALCFLAKQKFYFFNKKRARNFVSFKSISDGSGQYSKESLKKIAGELLSLRLGYFTDLVEALNLSTQSGYSESFILVINTFLFTYEMDAAYLKYSELTDYERVKADVIEMSEKLITMAKAGRFHGSALGEIYNNRATFHFLDKDFESAKLYAALARDEFLNAGLAHSAKIAQKTHSEAEAGVTIDDLSADPFDGVSQQDLLTFMEENARRIFGNEGYSSRR